MFANPYHCNLHSQYLMQLKLRSAAETLGTEKVAIVEKWSL